ncbi:MAG TPA: Re/Si-specific NAD(P)(+) transhydrogenase subunit alpha [Gemmatimonadaceae bacterium]|nr:Re/Si-specific NAD(P)(+) transhydrogenase subunit alpha [Gemmatimonadaceae bacterium]
MTGAAWAGKLSAMLLGVPREITPGERRVALVPETVEKLVRSGVGVSIQAGAGAASFLADHAYEAAGATISTDARSLYERSDVIVKINRPLEPATGSRDGVNEVELLKRGALLIAVLQPFANPELVQRLAERGITCISMDAIPRIARAQALDVLSSMSTVTGYSAVLLAASSLPRFFPLLMTAAGTITPARVFVIGAGVAGLQAIATSRRLGAVVEAFDTRPAVREQVQSLGATFVEAALGAQDTEDQRGYAKELSEDAHRRELELIGGRVRDADVVITTALIPGQRAPTLITTDMVRAMKPGSVIVDLAAEFGGNCELSRPGESVSEHGVTIHAPLHFSSTLPVHASQMYSRNIAALLALIIKEGALHLDFDDQIIRDACVAHDGKVVHEGVRARLAAVAS